MSYYKPWDREEKLGPPPWWPGNSKVMAWEAAHGHDVRLKCYPEFGCKLLEPAHERLFAAARKIVQEMGEMIHPDCHLLVHPCVDCEHLIKWRDALGEALEEADV